MAIRRLSLTRGDDISYTLTFKKLDGTPYNIKNWVVFFTLKTNYDLPDTQASLQKIVTSFADSTSGTSGVAVVSLAAADTCNLEPMEYYYDFAVRTSANKSLTIVKGKFDLLYDVTITAGTAGTAT